jgi:Patatin-like phospholipase
MQDVRSLSLFHGTKLTWRARFVCATSAHHAETTVLSSYYSDRRGNDLRSVARIWEVARATSAATSFFDPIVIGGERFVDGATGANNPIHQLWTEATDTFSKGLNWRLEDHIQSLVSVGTGKLHLTAFSTSLLDIGKVLVDIATNSDQIADTFHKLHSNLYLERRAFRFNVGQGLENIGLEEESKMPDIQAVTRRYIQTEEVFTLMRECVENLRRRDCMLDFA